MQERPYAARYDETAQRLVVSGAVDELSAPAFRSDLDAAVAAGAVAVDLSDVDYFPSVAVSALILGFLKRAEDSASAGDVVAAPGTVAQRVLHLSGIPHRAP